MLRDRTDMNRTRAAYLESARVAAGLVAHPEVSARWDEPGASEGMTVGAIAAHLVSSGIEILIPYLEAESPPGTRVLEPSRYFSGQSLDLEHEGHREVRKKAEVGARRGAAALATDASAAVSGLTVRIGEQPEGRRIQVLSAFDMTLDGFLVTRMVELLAHTDDLAASVAVATPESTTRRGDAVVSCLSDVARRRHGDLAVLRASHSARAQHGRRLPRFLVDADRHCDPPARARDHVR
jgi:nucleotide-binding universal stress UspA family protein